MKKIYFFILLLTSPFFSIAQAGEWVWLKGSNIPNDPGSHGQLGVPGKSNEPPALYEACEWTDTSGNFWLYGGIDPYDSAHNDLWKYSPSDTEWTWMTGTNARNDTGDYGTIRVPSATNRPPSLGFGVDTWVDLNGDLWMFGGAYKAKTYGDLWKYSISANVWTWMKGPGKPNQRGVNGIKGTPDIANTPAGRSESATAWTDNTGDLWLFGGDFRNDMWRYNITSDTWTWMNGDTIVYGTPHYGALGSEAAGNTPGGRYSYARWKDKKGNLWLYSGGRPSYFDQIGDVWRFNPVTNKWAWMNGSNTYCGGLNADVLPTWGSQCVTSASNNPGCRWENRATWTDANGNFWMWGGVYGNLFQLAFNDLWMYCVTDNKWTWMAGPNSYNAGGYWGTKGIAGPDNIPDGRGGSIGWIDKQGHFYLFGGANSTGPPFYQLPRYNDLWMFTIDPNCGTCATSILPPVASFQANDTVICANGLINFTDHSTNATSWQWSFPGAVVATSTVKNPQNIMYKTAGKYDVTLQVFNSVGNNSVTLTNYITVNPTPPIPKIIKSNDTLFCSFDTSYYTYQWHDTNGVAISGKTDSFLVITKSGNYTVEITSKNGCKIAGGINLTVGLQPYSVDGLQFTVIPNPAFNNVTVSLPYMIYNGLLILKMTDIMGNIIYKEKVQTQNTVLLLDDLAKGIYFISVEGEGVLWTKKMVKL